jgi:ribosomal protein S21
MALVVKAGKQDSNDQVIKKFKKKVLQEDIVTKIRERQFHKKPSLIKKEKMTEYRKRKKRRLQAARRAKN